MKKEATQETEQRGPMQRVVRRQERQKTLIMAEAQRIADEEGISKITAERLADAADISRATLYNLFGDLGSIADEIYRKAKGRK